MAAAPFKVKALFEYTSGHDDDLPFDVDQIITVTDVDDPDWYGGEYVDASGEKREGIFPRNFVEKYEPVAPPRPTRAKKKEAEPAPPTPASPPAAPEPEPELEPENEPVPEPVPEHTKPVLDESSEETPMASPPPLPPVAAEPRSPKAPAVPAPKAAEPFAPAASASEAPTGDATSDVRKVSGPARGGPPPVSEKPASSSFKDRIAAFNKSAAPPIAPFKPGGLGSGGGSSFVKKPFVAPPPSRNAYVPPPREKPAPKVYRRDEDPEIKEKEAENTENAARAGLVAGSSQEGEDEDQPKPMSLKERMALLQKQQTEAAQRHADAAAKKEKPKRPPPKKRTESQDPVERASLEAPETPSLDRSATDSLDEAQPVPPPRQPLPVRRKSKSVPEDGNEADMSGAGDTTEGPEELTERDDSDTQPRRLSQAPKVEAAEEKEGYEDEAEEGEDEQEDEEDPEVRRKEELRARMAKMSAGMGGMGGMGMMGMHNPFAAPLGSAGPATKKKPAPAGRRSSEHAREEVVSPRPAPPVPTAMALPGMGRESHQEDIEEGEEQDSPMGEDITPVATTSPRAAAAEPLKSPMAPPPVPGGRPAPPPVPAESRPVPPLPPAAISEPSVGSESDDELSESQIKSIETPRAEAPPAARAPPPPIPVASPTMAPMSPRSTGNRSSFGGDELSPISPGRPNKRDSRPPPPIPGAAPPAPSQTRPPPPPPPGAGLARTSTSDERAPPMKPGRLDNGEEGEITDYDGDYDTDIASSAPHKDALKSHARDSSLDETTSLRSPVTEAPPPSLPPPIPASAPRAVPPPVPSQPPPPPAGRPSADMPRGAPPPPPPAPAPTVPESSAQGDDDEYDPFRYSGAQPGATTVSYSIPAANDDVRSPDAAPSYQSPSAPANRSLPPAPPQAAPSRAPPRQSMDAQRPIGGRRSMDVGRPSISAELGFVANDVDLAQHTSWWLQPNGLPPVFQGRRDIFFESDESTTSAPGGRTVVTKDVYVLFQDYSQTIITARFDPQNPSDTNLDQRHEPPPRSLRQDQLEQAYERFGLQISNSVSSKKDSVVGDGTPQALVFELLKPFKDVLLPVGTRAYGALVYANMANASTHMSDEIRPGDIISIRNAKFQGKHGPMHAKYSMEVGKPDHVAVVAEWDGTKKKVRAWEQGRENKKVKQESFKLDDLRSGEVKVWRVMPRSWVGWDSQN